METREAVDKIILELKNDEGYYFSWQSNIAMQFKDVCLESGIQFPQLHEVSNRAAIRFLNLLISQREAKP